jgi:hypothetical protein
MDYEAEGEYDSDYSGEEIVGYIEETDSILLASGEVIQNNNQFSKEDLKYLVKSSQFKKLQ